MAEKLALGLMSGTSADGLTVALVEFGRGLSVLGHRTYAYSPALRRRILKAPAMSAPELSRLDFDLGRVFARRAADFLKARRVSPRRLECVGSHGQTVVHRPQGTAPSTLQIGEASFAAERLGVPVVCDFRPRDMAAGGQGAPIVPAFDEALFGRGAPAILQNIGGIANAALVGRGVKTAAFDNGPGNALIDAAVRRMTRGRKNYDAGGRIARSGRADDRLVARLLKNPYFLRKPPKTLDRGTFSEAYLEKHFPRGKMRPADVVATLTLFSAGAIADSYRRHLPLRRVRRAIVSGGGALNPVLMEHLSRLAAPLCVETIDAYGIPAMAKEAAAVAWMARRALGGRSNHSPAATGAARRRVLGKIIPA